MTRCRVGTNGARLGPLLKCRLAKTDSHGILNLRRRGAENLGNSYPIGALSQSGQ